MHSSTCILPFNCCDSTSSAQALRSAAQIEDTAAGEEEGEGEDMHEEIAEHDNAAAVLPPFAAAAEEEEELELFEEDFDYGIATNFLPTLNAAMNRAQQADRVQEAIQPVRAAPVPTAVNLAGNIPCFMLFLKYSYGVM